MCLQWCHVTHQLLDNDLSCDHCPLARAMRADQRCDACAHRVNRAGKDPICALTRQPLPLAGGCCHANVVRDAPPGGVLWLADADVAPGLLARRGARDVAALFDRSSTAPDYERDADGRLRVALARLSIPEVYGVPSPAWDAALGRARPAPVWGPALEAAAAPRHGDAVLALLDQMDAALASDLATRAVLREQLRALLPLPDPWDAIVHDAIALLEESTP